MEAYPHLKFEREDFLNERRPGRGKGPAEPKDIVGHAHILQDSLRSAGSVGSNDIPGFDARPLFKLSVGALAPEEIAKGFPGVEVVSQEDGGYALVFVSDKALAEFEARLSSLAEGRKPPYAKILYALQAFDHWTPEDRKGWALKHEGFPEAEQFVLDVELWPLGRDSERVAMRRAFEQWLLKAEIDILDRVNTDSFVAYRIKTLRRHADSLLRHRDVRTVDLPPRLGMDPSIFRLDVKDVSQVPQPSTNAPLVAILDSGIASGHPLIAPAVGDSQGFVGANRQAHDDHGHGTLVAGLVLYDDVEECVQAKQFVPHLRILSGRIFDGNAEVDPRFIENIVEEAVRYFHTAYRCRVFNLSYGDCNKPYLGGRVRGLAYTLDRLSRELDVLFIVPTGNVNGRLYDDLTDTYPECLLEDDAAIIDPAPALNVLTVGSLARWDKAHNAQRYPKDINAIPVARRGQPSPFSRCGCSVKGAIKPELVAYGGNQALDPHTRQVADKGLGELSFSKDFLEGRLLAEDIGSSYAAPHVAHAAGRLLAEIPNASANLLRALLVAHAKIPHAAIELFSEDEDTLARTVGYGMIDSSALYRSSEEQVTLIAESALLDKTNHYYEVPIPDCLYSLGLRRREIIAALSYCPPVRTTRVDYRASRLQFRLIEAETLKSAMDAFDKATKDTVKGISEPKLSKAFYGTKKRECGTVQASTWVAKAARTKKLFVVVSRNDHTWGVDMTKEIEPYALVVRLCDVENEQARLYTEIRTMLQTRVQARGRARL